MTRPLFTLAPTPKLTERQLIAWAAVFSSTRPLTARNVGAHLHARKGKHSLYEDCDYCHSDGQSVLQSKALKQLVTYSNVDGRRVYRPRRPVARTNAQTSELPDWLGEA